MSDPSARRDPFELPEYSVAAVAAACAMSNECSRLIAELRFVGLTPRARVVAASLLEIMLKAAPVLEDLAILPRPVTSQERREIAKLKVAMRQIKKRLVPRRVPT